VAELEVLRVLKAELGGKIPLRAFFDLIVGTKYVSSFSTNFCFVSRLTDWLLALGGSLL
jgi:hypothetical protein